MKRALIPGSFAPITVGHYDMVKRCAEMFDEVYVVMFRNTEKEGKGIFTFEQCFEMLKISVARLPNVKADMSEGLLVDYAAKNGIDVIVKGVRDTIDFEYEYGLFVINEDIGGIDTMFMPSRPQYKHISSTFVRDMIKYGRDITPYVPDGVGEYIKEITKNK